MYKTVSLIKPLQFDCKVNFPFTSYFGYCMLAQVNSLVKLIRDKRTNERAPNNKTKEDNKYPFNFMGAVVVVVVVVLCGGR